MASRQAASAPRAELRRIAERARPPSLTGEGILPVLPALAQILPEAGLRRGSSVEVSRSTSLALALAAGPSVAGTWCAVVGGRALGLVAAAEMGIALERFPMITAAGRWWTRAVAATVEAFDLVLVRPVPGVPAAEARRISALVRERGAVLLVCGPGWPERTDLLLQAVRSDWRGLERGHGRLRARRMEIVVSGRGAASAPRRAALWLPAADGTIAVADEAIASTKIPVARAGAAG